VSDSVSFGGWCQKGCICGPSVSVGKINQLLLVSDTVVLHLFFCFLKLFLFKNILKYKHFNKKKHLKQFINFFV